VGSATLENISSFLSSLALNVNSPQGTTSERFSGSDVYQSRFRLSSLTASILITSIATIHNFIRAKGEEVIPT
jgi:hypothetical protein